MPPGSGNPRRGARRERVVPGSATSALNGMKCRTRHRVNTTVSWEYTERLSKHGLHPNAPRPVRKDASTRVAVKCGVLPSAPTNELGIPSDFHVIEEADGVVLKEGKAPVEAGDRGFICGPRALRREGSPPVLPGDGVRRLLEVSWLKKPFFSHSPTPGPAYLPIIRLSCRLATRHGD